MAREAASLVLLDDDFSSIVAAVRLGRRIYDNLRKAMAYILAVHVPIAGISLLPVLPACRWCSMPVHIAFLELIIDPACSVVFEAEPEEPDVMRRPPRSPRAAPLFSGRVLIGQPVAGRPVAPRGQRRLSVQPCTAEPAERGCARRSPSSRSCCPTSP